MPGNIIRMEDTRIPKMILDTKSEGTRRVGRHKLKCLDDVEADIKTLHTKIWRLKGENRVIVRRKRRRVAP
jgi:hypothetical protein